MSRIYNLQLQKWFILKSNQTGINWQPLEPWSYLTKRMPSLWQCCFWCHTFGYSVNLNMKVWGQNCAADKDTIKLKTRKMYSIMFILYVTIFKQLQISRTDDLCKCQSYKSLSQSKIVVYPEQIFEYYADCWELRCENQIGKVKRS